MEETLQQIPDPAEEAAPEREEAAAAQVEETVPVEEAAPPAQKKSGIAQFFTATRLAYLALFTAISYVLSLLDFALLPGSPVSFLKLDFSNVFVMLAGFSLGPVSGCIVAVLKELIHALTVGHTAFIGELANVLFVLPYMLIPALFYKKHKGIKVVLLTLALGCVAQCLVSMPVNYLLNFPAFYVAFVPNGTWQAGQRLFIDTWYWALLFNLLKSVIVSVLTFIVYKPLSLLIKKTNEKFSRKKSKNAK